MDRADYAEPILRARAALQTAERLLMAGRPEEAKAAAEFVETWAAILCHVCVQMAREQAQRDA